MLSTNTTFHTNTNLASLARVNASSTRTAEVTISIALDSYRAPGYEHQADTASYKLVCASR